MVEDINGITPELLSNYKQMSVELEQKVTDLRWQFVRENEELAKLSELHKDTIEAVRQKDTVETELIELKKTVSSEEKKNQLLLSANRSLELENRKLRRDNNVMKKYQRAFGLFLKTIDRLEPKSKKIRRPKEGMRSSKR